MQNSSRVGRGCPLKLGFFERTWQMLTYSCTGYCREPVRLGAHTQPHPPPSARVSPARLTPMRRARVAMDISLLSRNGFTPLRQPPCVRQVPAS
jgi:hypothetical protein